MSDPARELVNNQTIIAGLIGLVGIIITGLLSFFGGRGSVQAQLQGQLNLSFKEFTDQLQEEHASDRSDIAGCRRRCGELEGQLRGLEQHLASLENLLRAHGISVPEAAKVATVFVLDSGGEE